jgi:hypothetical protein
VPVTLVGGVRALLCKGGAKRAAPHRRDCQGEAAAAMRAAQALEKAGDAAPPEWRVRQLMALAMCQAECGRADEAGRVLGRAQDLANRCGLESRVRAAGGSLNSRWKLLRSCLLACP